MEVRTVLAGETGITYQWTKKSVKNLNLRIRPDGSVHLSTPRRVSAAAADAFVKSRARWIAEATVRIAIRQAQKPAAAPLADGGYIEHLGRRLILEASPTAKTAAVEGERLILPVKKPLDSTAIEKALTRWQGEQLAEIFTQCSQGFYPLFAGKHLAQLPALKIRRMKSRWGSCNRPKNLITLNSRLLEKPYPAVEYVILHEYAHFAVGDHSAAFYRLVGTYMPDYKARRGLLK